MKAAEALEIQRRARQFEETEALTRVQLMQSARAGDRNALALLQSRYHLRLPLIEHALNGRTDKVGAN